MKTFTITAIFLFCCSAMGAQTFPYDLDERGKEDTVTHAYRLRSFSDHVQVFGFDTVTVEVYFEQRITAKVSGNSPMAFVSKCSSTSLLHTTAAAGSYIYPTNRRDGRYLLYFFRNGCYVETSIDCLPDGTSSHSHQIWGNCRPPKKITRL